MPDIDGIFSVDEMFADDGQWGRLHDAMAELSGREHTKAECRAVWDGLPQDLRGQARVWGLGDTCVGDEVFEHLRDSGWTGS